MARRITVGQIYSNLGKLAIPATKSWAHLKIIAVEDPDEINTQTHKPADQFTERQITRCQPHGYLKLTSNL